MIELCTCVSFTGSDTNNQICGTGFCEEFSVWQYSSGTYEFILIKYLLIYNEHQTKDKSKIMEKQTFSWQEIFVT